MKEYISSKEIELNKIIRWLDKEIERVSALPVDSSTGENIYKNNLNNSLAEAREGAYGYKELLSSKED